MISPSLWGIFPSPTLSLFCFFPVSEIGPPLHCPLLSLPFTSTVQTYFSVSFGKGRDYCVPCFFPSTSQFSLGIYIQGSLYIWSYFSSWALSSQFQLLAVQLYL